MVKLRLDQRVVSDGLADTRSRARALILAGDVLVNGLVETRAGHPASDDDVVTLRQKPRFVSRGGEKLDHALDAFTIGVEGMIAADLGASTGGFTDCLLQRGAVKVYAVDVGHGQLDLKVRNDVRVVVMEKTNARYIETLPEQVDLVVIDVSFISLDLIFPVVARILRDDGVCVPLIKPQFEAGRGEIGKGGVVRDPAIHRAVLERAAASATRHGLAVEGMVASPLQGPAGNVEFLALLRPGEATRPVESMIDAALSEAAQIGAPS
ncbi:MAG TPA: TlyA family RNA methyltransferase [Thermomicrobiales bacterium]|nr:TlyA family RNA methyltransferase [Thermomicrobiales bacterium]